MCRMIWTELSRLLKDPKTFRSQNDLLDWGASINLQDTKLPEISR
ncbi:hypothetical protein EYZ11_003629 [Aspergillus tanneri]|uniref:Uncharacterized protein n=1 Tax=Aspergillus tanneri TaxID=1220188 RepID=A0A4S3JMW0_9EURO|nr:hypothetical protein EYZ11_003629 [Aspergillus tanneri]